VRLWLKEGKNLAVRKCFAHHGFGTLRLVRLGFGPCTLQGLEPGGVAPVTGEALEELRRRAERTAMQDARHIEWRQLMPD